MISFHREATNKEGLVNDDIEQGGDVGSEEPEVPNFLSR